MKIFVWSCVLSLLLVSCGLRYTPVQTQQSTDQSRKELIESTVQNDFSSLNKTYTPIGFAKTVEIKPLSYKKLDSLFAQKYELEKRGRDDKSLDEAIEMQRIVCQNDTNQILYMIRHVFTLTDKDSTAEILSGDFYINKQNELKNVKFTESYHIDKRYINYFETYAFELPFLGGDQLSQEEANFYKMYKEELNRRQDKDAFLENTLKIMQIAHYKQSLDTQTLLKELTRKIVHQDKTNYTDEVFVKIDQFKDDNGNLLEYNVIYQFALKTPTDYTTHRYELTFDPFLMLLDSHETPNF